LNEPYSGFRKSTLIYIHILLVYAKLMCSDNVSRFLNINKHMLSTELNREFTLFVIICFLYIISVLASGYNSMSKTELD